MRSLASANGDRAGRTIVWTICRSLVFPAIGALCAFWWVTDFYLPRFGLGTVERISALGRHLQSGFAVDNVAVCLGNSITMEGIDASIVEATLGGQWHVENLATSGAGPTEFQIVLPKLLNARPRIVVMGIQPQDIGLLFDLPADKVFAYSYAGFVEDWPKDWSKRIFPGLSNESYEALTSETWRQCLHFRRAPLNALNDGVRIWLRHGLRDIDEGNWKAPYQLLISIQDDRLTRHLRQVNELTDSRLAHGVRDGAEEIQRVTQLVKCAGAEPMLVVSPIHPGLRPPGQAALEELRHLLQTLASEKGISYADASGLLSADDFADALHPNELGRRKYSQFLGEELAKVPTDERAGGGHTVTD